MRDGNGAGLVELARLLGECLARGRRVDIDGLGCFVPGPDGRPGFVSERRPGVFVAYVQEDAGPAGRICDALAAAGFDPWLDRRKLLPGQNWPRSIENAIETADFFLACFSSRSVRKRGGFQAEIRYALDCARRVPLDQVFLIPVRLDECPVPRRVQREWQYVDLFPDWARGLRRVMTVMRRQARLRPRPACVMQAERPAAQPADC